MTSSSTRFASKFVVTEVKGDLILRDNSYLSKEEGKITRLSAGRKRQNLHRSLNCLTQVDIAGKESVGLLAVDVGIVGVGRLEGGR